MSVSNILDEHNLIRKEFIPDAVTNKIKALEEFVRVISEAIEIEGYVYNGEYQGVYDHPHVVPEEPPVEEPPVVDPTVDPVPEPTVTITITDTTTQTTTTTTVPAVTDQSK